MAKTESQGGGGVEEIKGTIRPYLYLISSCLIFYLILKNILLGEASQAQGHPCRRGEEIGSEEEGGGGTSPT